jgi:hypothetical protein
MNGSVSFVGAKAGKPQPWTTYRILSRYKMCNVYREQDRVTAWIRENWRAPYADHPNLWFAMCVARAINWPETLEEIAFPDTWNPKRVVAVLEDRMLPASRPTRPSVLSIKPTSGAPARRLYVGAVVNARQNPATSYTKPENGKATA